MSQSVSAASPAARARSSEAAVASTTPPRFELTDVCRSWGARKALCGVDMTIEPGERIALVGPSGAGKSTLLRIVNGVLRPSTGKILADGMDVMRFSRRQLIRYRRRFGIVSQGSQLVPQLSVHQNVIAGRLPSWPWYLAAASLFWPMERDRVAAHLGRVGLRDRQWDITSTLSGGQQQRVAIARALAGEPHVILADEPTASLDPVTARDVTKLLLDTTRDRCVTLIFCTHWITEITSLVDRIVGIRDGAIVIDAPAKEVTERDLEDLYVDSDERY